MTTRFIPGEGFSVYSSMYNTCLSMQGWISMIHNRLRLQWQQELIKVKWWQLIVFAFKVEESKIWSHIPS